MEKTAEENPKEYVFNRVGRELPASPVAEAIKWERVLTGADLKKFMAARMPSSNVLEKLRTLEKYTSPVIRRTPNAKN